MFKEMSTLIDLPEIKFFWVAYLLDESWLALSPRVADHLKVTDGFF